MILSETGLKGTIDSNRIEVIDYLKAVAIIFVILDHIGIVSNDNVLYCFGIRMAVPIFMTLSGYTFSIAYSKANGIKEMYSWTFIKNKLFRFIFPALLTCIMICIIEGENTNVLMRFIMGDYGPGSYYPMLMIQLVLIFPILFLALRNRKNIWMIVLLCILFEVMSFSIQMNNTVYRILVFRYVMYIVGGIIIFQEQRFSLKVLVSFFAIGCLYIYAVKLGYEPYIFKNWSNTAAPVALYIVPVIYLVIGKFKTLHIGNVIGKICGNIGKASYHILFAQILTRKLLMSIGNASFFYIILIRLILSIILGLIFWKIESKLLQFKRKRMNS